MLIHALVLDDITALQFLLPNNRWLSEVYLPSKQKVWYHRIYTIITHILQYLWYHFV
jgi:hypothetical protein